MTVTQFYRFIGHRCKALSIRLLLGLVLGLIPLATVRPQAGEGLLAWGIRGQGFIDGRAGNDYYFGPSLSYSNYYLFGHKLQLQGTYLTNRPEAAWRQGVPVTDWYLVTPLWHWNRNGFFDPVFQVDMGWVWFDDEGLDLNGDGNNANFVTAPSLGLNVNLMQGQYGLQFTIGYHILASSVVNPGLATVTFWGMM